MVASVTLSLRERKRSHLFLHQVLTKACWSGLYDMPVAEPNTMSRGQLVVLTGQVEGRCLPLELKGGASFI